MAAGARSTVRSCWVSLPMTAIACKSPNAEPVDVWTTQARCPQAHRFSNSNRTEQNEKCVTHVAGQNCYPCPRLLTRRARIESVLITKVCVDMNGTCFSGDASRPVRRLRSSLRNWQRRGRLDPLHGEARCDVLERHRGDQAFV